MITKPSQTIENCRIKIGPLASNASHGNNGAFLILGPSRNTLKVIVSDGLGWDHVSVSRADKTPSWDEMCFIKELFFMEDETVIQYHPAKKDYVNFHAFCLHMWRSQVLEIPTPPSMMVGPKKRR